MPISRLTGFATGMDTDSIIKKLMDAERIPLNRLKQNQQRQIWLIDSYRQWNTDLFTFRNNTLFNMNLSATYNTNDVGISMPNSISATANSNAITGTYSISVKQLAESASLIGRKVKLDSTKTLGSVDQGVRQLTANTSISINVYNDVNNPTAAQTATIDVKTTDTINDVVSKINSATDSSGKSLGLQANYDVNLQQFIVKTKATGTTTKIDLTSSSASGQAFLSNTLGIGTHASVTGNVINNLKIKSGTNDTLTIDLGGGKTSTITITAGTYATSQDLVDEINLQIGNNSSLATNVTAAVDSTGNLTLNSEVTGTQSAITVSGTSVASIGFTTTSSTGTAGTLIATGQNADVTFNGQQINTFTSNNVTIMGINFTLKSSTVDGSGNVTTTDVTVSKNIDTVVKNIKDFVEKYNDLLDRMNNITTEAVYRDYLPLLDEQRNEMTEKQVEQWETKAKSGLLRGDSIITDLVNKMRNEMSSVVSNGSSYNSLASIGISSKSYQDKGRLYVDETKLKTALETDPDAVEKLFSQMGDTSKGTNGLINRLSDVMLQGVRNLTTKAGIAGNSQYDQSIIGRMLSRIQTDITSQTMKLTNKENQYYRQFASMESAVSKFNSQSSWLSSQMSGGQ